MNLLWMIIGGFFVGALAKFIMPGNDPGGILVTILLGIAGSAIGGWIGSLIGAGGLVMSWILAIAGAVLLLYLYRTFVANKSKK